MRALCVALIALLLAAGMAFAAAPIHGAAPPIRLNSKEGVLVWINAYDPNRDLARAPSMMKTASDVGSLSDPEAAGVYVGFMAGLIGSNPQKADAIIKKLVLMRPADHWAVVRAIAYSGNPDWRGLMRRFAPMMPTRAVMAQRYLEGRLPTPDTPVPDDKISWKDRINPTKWFAKKDEPVSDTPPPEEKTSWKDRINPAKWFAKKKNKEEKPIPLQERPEMLDVYWGYYFATRGAPPLERMIKLLPWVEERDSVDKLTIGSMAKFTMAVNASRDPKLLGLLKTLQTQQTDKETSRQLAQTIEVAETEEISTLRKTTLDRLDELKRTGPGSKRDMAGWGKIVEGAISVGCVAAAATGDTALGLPCVLGGAGTSALLYYWATP
jgi:hypothetical protein